MSLRRFAPLLALVLWTGCKGVDDYMTDLTVVDPSDSTNVFDRPVIIFDAGQLLHEAMVGIGEAEELEFDVAMSALARACVILGQADKNALLRADAAVLIGHIAARVPLPPIDEPLEAADDAKSIEHVTTLAGIRNPNLISGSILSLESPDEAARQQALDILRERAGQDYGTDVDAWQKWWETARPDEEKRFLEEAKEPIRRLGSVRYRFASQPRGVLRFLAFLLRQSSSKEFHDYAVPYVQCVARQAVVLQLIEKVNDEDYEVRCDVADAMVRILDRSFGEPLVKQLQRDRDPQAIMRIVRVLAHYPDRRSILALLTVMRQEDTRIRLTASESLRAITGEDFGVDWDAWAAWWQKTGDPRWP